MKRSRGGSLFLLLTPDELLARLATLVPPPRTHALRYHGLFAPNSNHRASVVPAATPTAPCDAHPGLEPRSPDDPAPSPRTATPAGVASFGLSPPEPVEPAGPRYRIPWAELLRKVFAVDVLDCPRCHGRLEVIAYIAEPTVARRILDHLGLDSQGPPVAKARGPDEPPDSDPGPDYAAADPIFDE